MRALELWRKRKRNSAIAQQLPESLDLFVLMLQAGLDFQVALDHYLETAPRHALYEVWSTFQTELRTGVSRRDALRNLIQRNDEPTLLETARALLQGLELGSSLSPILKTQARALRQKQAFRAEKQAAVAPLKLMFPLLVFIFPTLFAILLTPLWLQNRGMGLP